MTIYIVLGILFIHWVADFVLQTDEQAKGKSKEWTPLLAHTSVYSLVWLIAAASYCLYTGDPDLKAIVLFVMITFTVHTFTDYFTSRLNSHLWGKGAVHNFFVSVGFDQWLHYAQLFITYQYLFNP